MARDPASPAMPFFGIAAFPSLHLATTGLGLLAAWRFSRWLLVVLIPLNLLVAWGGWWAAGRLAAPAPVERERPSPST